MSNAYHPGQDAAERRIAAAVSEAMGIDFEMVSVAVFGKKVVLEGTAPSYVAKARAGESVRRAGFPVVDNCLRVMPGIPSAII